MFPYGVDWDRFLVSPIPTDEMFPTLCVCVWIMWKCVCVLWILCGLFQIFVTPIVTVEMFRYCVCVWIMWKKCVLNLTRTECDKNVCVLNLTRTPPWLDKMYSTMCGLFQIPMSPIVTNQMSQCAGCQSRRCVCCGGRSRSLDGGCRHWWDTWSYLQLVPSFRIVLHSQQGYVVWRACPVQMVYKPSNCNLVWSLSSYKKYRHGQRHVFQQVFWTIWWYRAEQ